MASSSVAKGSRQTTGPKISQRPTCVAGSISARSEEHTSELQSLMRISYAGVHRALPVLTHSFPPRRSSDLHEVDTGARGFVDMNAAHLQAPGSVEGVLQAVGEDTRSEPERCDIHAADGLIQRGEGQQADDRPEDLAAADLRRRVDIGEIGRAHV